MKLGLPLAPPAARSFDFTALGENSLDLVCVVPSFPSPDDKVRVSGLLELPGGQAATAAVACARLGWRARYAGAIGDDGAGKLLRESLARERVGTVLVERAGVRSRTAVVLVDQATGSRTVLEARDSALDVGPDEMALDVLADTRILLVDATDPTHAQCAAVAARAAGARVILDIDEASEAGLALAREVDVVIAPAAFVTDATGRAGLGPALEELARDLQAAVIVATLGREGALARCRGREVRVAAVQVDVVDTTGAGDAFRAGFASGWLASGSGDPELEDLLRVAATVAALACRGLGAQTTLPAAAEVTELAGRRV
jgi:sugar/nucleoside kinase (ribokinase family)